MHMPPPARCGPAPPMHPRPRFSLPALQHAPRQNFAGLRLSGRQPLAVRAPGAGRGDAGRRQRQLPLRAGGVPALPQRHLVQPGHAGAHPAALARRGPRQWRRRRRRRMEPLRGALHLHCCVHGAPRYAGGWVSLGRVFFLCWPWGQEGLGREGGGEGRWALLWAPETGTGALTEGVHLRHAPTRSRELQPAAVVSRAGASPLCCAGPLSAAGDAGALAADNRSFYDHDSALASSEDDAERRRRPGSGSGSGSMRGAGGGSRWAGVLHPAARFRGCHARALRKRGRGAWQACGGLIVLPLCRAAWPQH